MLRFLARRAGIALGILFVLSFLMYGMLDLAMDPLDDLRISTSPAKDQMIATRVAQLNLDLPWWQRWFMWLTHFVQGDLGVAWRSGRRVNDLLGPAVGTSIQLVFTATILAILLGVTVGIISALRQYTTFDYALTFVSFVLYSLPIFWVAVLLKQFLAIDINNYLENPVINWPLIIGLSVVAGLFWAGALGGSRVRKLAVFASATAVTFGILVYVLASGWLEAPTIGWLGVGVIGLAVALGGTTLFAGINNKRALYSSLTTAAVGVVAYFFSNWFFHSYVANIWILLGFFAAAIAIAVAIGYAFGGPDRQVSARGAVLVAVFQSVFVYLDQVLQGWTIYVNSPAVGGRPIATLGSETPNLGGDFWIQQLDRFTHLLLPSIALVLISFATYVRYQRGAMLEVLTQDYIRTARAKGLSERVVIVRHALRNALMPLTSILPLDLVGMIGGAVITETIFSWSGMGRLFITSMQGSEPDPVMAYVMIVGALAMVANLTADFLYAVIDPRIRVNA